MVDNSVMFVPHTTRAGRPRDMRFGTSVSIHLLCPHLCYYVVSRPAVPQNTEYLRIFPIYISHILLFSCPTNLLPVPRKVFLSGKFNLRMRGRIDKKILFKYFYLHLQNRAYYNGTPPASNILKFYSNNAANINMYSPYRPISHRYPTYYPLSHDSYHFKQSPSRKPSKSPEPYKPPFPLPPKPTKPISLCPEQDDIMHFVQHGVAAAFRKSLSVSIYETC